MVAENILTYYTESMKKPLVGTVEYEIEKAKNDTARKSLLLHACCGPCASSVLEYLSAYFDITVFFYNPNIMPNEEFILREKALKDVISHFDNVKLVVPTQSADEYLSLVDGYENCPEGGDRCSICFDFRLEKCADFMQKNAQKFDFFATTLTVSPHKNAQLINEIGEKIAQKYGVNYLSSNFKKRDGYLRSIQLCMEWNIYRQAYCGCTFSLSK